MKKVRILVIVLIALVCFSTLLASCNKEATNDNTTVKATTAAKTTAKATTAAATTPKATTAEATTPAVTTPAATTAAAEMEVKFSDDFSGDLAKWDIYNGSWAVKEGAATLDPAGDGAKIMAKGTDFADFVLEADMTINETVEGQSVFNAGFVFRASEPGKGADAYNGYYVGLSTSGVVSGRADAGAWIGFAEQGLENEVALGDKVHLKLEVKGDEMIFYVDDAEYYLEDTNDQDLEFFTTGMIGLRVWQCGATYDNVKVSVAK